jgi:hypothetical protein
MAPQVTFDKSLSTFACRYGAQSFTAMTSASVAMADLLAIRSIIP